MFRLKEHEKATVVIEKIPYRHIESIFSHFMLFKAIEK